MKKNHIPSIIVILSLCLFFSCKSGNSFEAMMTKSAVIPSDLQVEYQKMETVGFIHFTVNTFTDKEWGYGDEDPEIFNPSELDVEQWVQSAKDAGLKELILTAKHHDGFCLWPSLYTEHSVKNSPYKEGRGDIVLEFVSACTKHGLKAGLYLSPWDRNHKDYGTPEYITYYRNQLTELLSNYGEITEIWFDGANGGDGFYGGANETRVIDRDTYYDWETTFKLVKELQNDILIFSDAGPDIHWIGNEHGFAGETFWSTINKDLLVIGSSDQKYLNMGDPEGQSWIIGQCDVSVRPGWFYHADQDERVKTPQELIDIYYKSVGRNAVLLLNLPPDKRGLIHENDVKSLKEFKQILDQTFAKDLSKGASCTASNSRAKKKFNPKNIIDGDENTFWTTADKVKTSELIIELAQEESFDRLLIQEAITYGQRVSKFQIEVFVNDQWETVFEGTTIGYKRLLRIPQIQSSKIKLKFIESNASPIISRVSVYKASELEN